MHDDGRNRVGREGPEQRLRVELERVALVGADKPGCGLIERVVQVRVSGRVGFEGEALLVVGGNYGSDFGYGGFEGADGSPFELRAWLESCAEATDQIGL